MIEFIYNRFKKQFNALAFSEQIPKKEKFAGYKFSFIDSKGVRYYEPIDLLDSGIKRKGKLHEHLVEYASQLTGSEITKMADTIDALINDKIHKGESPDYAGITFITKEMRTRRDNLIGTDIIFDIVCLYYVREDEEPDNYDIEVHNQKVERLKKDYDLGLNVFFCGEGINKLLGFQNTPEKELKQSLNRSQFLTKTWGKMMDDFIESSSLNKENNKKNLSTESATAPKQK